MNNLKDFIKTKETTSIPSEITIQTAIIGGLSMTSSPSSLTVADKEKFSKEVSQLAKSDGVITELSEALGIPKDSESEDDFVKRGKSILSGILKRKLIK